MSSIGNKSASGIKNEKFLACGISFEKNENAA
jgi:hypothetical protein